MMASKHRPLTVLSMLAVWLMASTMAPVVQSQMQVSMSGLQDAYSSGGLVQDRNGDGHVDFVNARLVFGQAASEGEVIAAANIAARFGFETESIDLPIHNTDTGIPVAIGRSGLSGTGIPPSVISVDLEPGIGVVSYLDGPGGPVIAVVGGDDRGLRAAALAFGGRAPYVWEVEGPTYRDVADAVSNALNEAGINVITSTVRNAVADERPGLRRLDVAVVTQPGEVGQAADVLTEISRTMDTPGDTAGQDTAATAPALRFEGLRLLRVDLSAPDDASAVVYVENQAEPAAHSGRRPGGGNKGGISLSNLYSNDGFLGDGDNNLIPDRVDVVLSPDSNPSPALVDLAARIALESTGMTYPMVVASSEIDEPESFPPLVLVGDDHPLIGQLLDSQKVSLPQLTAGEGWVGIVPDAFGEKSAVIVMGGDEAGEARAIEQLAEHSPHVWSRGKDRPTLGDLDEDLRRALSARSPLGQAAMAVYKLDQIAAEIRERDIVAADVDVFVEKADSGYADFLRARMERRFPTDSLNVSVGNLDVQDARSFLDQDVEIPSEVDAFRRYLRDHVLPVLRPGVPVSLEARLSEPPEVRQRLTREVLQELAEAGVRAEQVDVRIISAYKQGYSWLSEFVAPDLSAKNVDEVVIRFAEVGPPEGWPQQAMFTPTRWLLEIFPIDEVLARDLGLELSQIRFEMQPVGSVAYEVIGRRGGQTVHTETFEPAIHLRPYFDRFPNYEMSRVTTGWITGVVASDTVVNRRIVTDIEAFWDHFQSETLMQVYEHVMAVNEGKPRASDAPHFGELTVDVTLSEPDYRISVDQEQIASMEALHEEIYFGVLHFFDVLGRMARGQDLSYPGRVIPIVRPKSDGAAGTARISFTGFDAPGPLVNVTVWDRRGRKHDLRRELLPTSLETPRLLSGTVRTGEPGWTALGYRVQVDFPVDNRAEWVLRTSARNVDARITNAEQTTATLRAIEELRSAGLYRQQLAYDHVGELELAAYWGHEFDPDSQATARLAPNGLAPPIPQLDAGGYEWHGESMVQWETPIPPPEAADILARMATFREASVYRVGRSYLGKDIWAMDLMAPVDGAFWSQAKATARKPTVIYSARQHANEVSSTSHVLKLAEHILTDSAYADVLNAVNVVIHPITNPDGAQLAYDLYQITPNHMLHAGYLGSLGVDVASGQGSDDPMYPETKVRPKLWETWLPDIFLNPHGYPSHEWVQIFSEYAGWVRSRVTSQRSWWGMRGWFMPSFNYVDSPDFPRHREAAFEIRDRITERINALPEIRALNKRAYDRYRRYAFAFDTENFKMDFADSVLIYTSITGSSGGGGTMSNPRVTIWSGTTEAPDETASGEWLQLVASAGLAWDNAILFYLVEGNHEVERTDVAFADGVTFKVHRERPPKESEEN